MASKLHANAIITGNLDSFCLVCESILRKEDEAFKHVDKPLHRKNLALTPYSDKFASDRIRKVKMGYYCEFCNVLLSIVSKVNLHIAEEEHKHNKGRLLLQRVGADVIAFDNVTISAKTWHGIMGDVCVLCNTEFEDERVHISAYTHSLNSVQRSVKFGANNAIYRQVNDNTIQCLTCEIILASNTMNEHFNDSNHLQGYEKCQKDTNNNQSHKDTVDNNLVTNTSNVHHNDTNHCPVHDISEKDKNNNKNIKYTINSPPLVVNNDTFNKTRENEETIIKKNKANKEMRSKIIDSIGTYQKHAININLETDFAFCKKCLVNINFDYSDIEDHVRNHAALLNRNVNADLQYPTQIDRNLNRVDIKQDTGAPLSKKSDQESPAACLNSPSPIDHTTDRNKSTCTESNVKDAMIFAKSNNITYNANDSKAYCSVCEKTFSSSLKCMQEHVTGTGHKRMVKTTKNSAKEKVNLTSTKPKKIKKEVMKKFIKEGCSVTSMFSEDVIVVNRKYCIPILSFMMITEFNSKLRCQLCEENVAFYEDATAHYESTRHDRAMSETPVVTSVDSEFIREVRPGLFHCGFCNLVLANWTEMESHLQCDSHANKRSYFTRRLQLHLPGVIRHRERELLSNLFNMF